MTRTVTIHVSEVYIDDTLNKLDELINKMRKEFEEIKAVGGPQILAQRSCCMAIQQFEITED